MKNLIKLILQKFGYTIVNFNKSYSISEEFPPDAEESTRVILKKCKPFTMTSTDRQMALINSIEYIVKKKIPGAFIECGVWRGGSSMISAITLQSLGSTDREIYLFDTFQGMTEPTANDIGYDSESAKEKLNKEKKNTGIWCYASLNDVKQNMKSTNYPSEKIIYVEGPVEKTITKKFPDKKIALLRLDTDWYESTKHELNYLFPLVSEGGIIIIDDYGHWRGAKLAVDEYLQEHNINCYIHRIDYTGRLIVKD